MKTFVQKFKETFGADMGGPVIAFVAVMLIFGLAADNFLSLATFGSVAFQLPVMTVADLGKLPDTLPFTQVLFLRLMEL